MDFNFTDDQDQLRDAVRKWVQRSYTFDRRRSEESNGGFSRDAYNELAELGLTGLYIPEQYSGTGMGPVDGMVVMEELGRGIVLEPLSQAILAGAVLSAYAPESMRSYWLPQIASGEGLVVLAYQERSARYCIEKCETRAIKVGDTWRLTGIKSIVPAGDHADAFLVPAVMADAKMAIFLVERAADGVSTLPYQTLDGSRAAELVLSESPGALITLEGEDLLSHAIDIAIATSCAEAVGVMEMMLDITVEYMKTRKQFGVAIASFQALRHRVADMKMQLELARSMSYYASLKLNAPYEERRKAMARAKYQVGVSMRFVGQQAVQLHGGIGMTDEYIGSHYFRRLTQLESMFGDTMHHLGQVSKYMDDDAGVFDREVA
jgi:alkylation response protein AidB-like acyl-CoA dehydrogenase